MFYEYDQWYQDWSYMGHRVSRMGIKTHKVFKKIVNNSKTKRDRFITPVYLFEGKTISYRKKFNIGCVIRNKP